MLLSGDAAEVSPVVILVFVAVVIGASLFFVKMSSDQTVATIKKRFAGQILAECELRTPGCCSFITKDTFLIQSNQNCFLAFPLADIAYVHPYRDVSSGQWYFALRDREGKNKNLNCSMFCANGKVKPLKTPPLVAMSHADTVKLSEFLMSAAPHIQMAEK